MVEGRAGGAKNVRVRVRRWMRKEENKEKKERKSGKLAGKGSAGAGLAKGALIGPRAALTARLRSAPGLNRLSGGLWCLS